MALSFNSATPDYIYRDAPVTGYPFSISAWVYTIDVPANRVWVSLNDTASDNNNFIGYLGTNSVAFFFIQNVGTTQTSAGPALSLNTWYHICIVEETSGNHNMVVNGNSYGVSISERTPSSIDRYAIGIRADLTPDLPHNGYIAEVALWNVTLTFGEMKILSQGFSPMFVRPQKLLSYLPLINDNNIDLIDNKIWTTSGSPGIETHPPITYPAVTPKFLGHITAAAPAGGGARSYGAIF